jgi:hypothetical protein
MGITEENCCACAGEGFIRDSVGHYRCSRELTRLASDVVTKTEICVMLYQPVGPTGEGSATIGGSWNDYSDGGNPRIIGLFLQMAGCPSSIAARPLH